VDFFSEEFGNTESVRIEIMQGTINGAAVLVLSGSGLFGPAPTGLPLAAGQVLFDRGEDGQVLFGGQVFTGEGRSFSIFSPTATFAFDLDPELLPVSPSTGASASFTIANTGLAFQLNEKPFPSDQIRFGIEAMYTSFLGFEPVRDRILEATQGVSGGAPPAQQIFRGGFLSSLATGRGNDLFTNPGNALTIIQGAVTQVSKLRAFLGAISAQNLEPNQRQLEVHVQNLKASLSTIRDLDFAEATAEFVKRQIILQSSISVLANANAVPQAVLQLLQA
jgi:flagellin-like hook-associated protein FlgL